MKINPYTLSCTLSRLKVQERDGSKIFVSCDEVFLDIEAVSILRQAVVLNKITLKNPYVRLVLHKDKSFNFSDLIAPKPAKPGEKPTRFSVGNFQASNGRLEFVDQIKDKQHLLSDLQTAIASISNLKRNDHVPSRFELTAKLNGSPFRVTSDSRLFGSPISAVFHVNCKDINFPAYISYLPVGKKIDFKSCLIAAELDGNYSQQNKSSPFLELNGKVSFKDIEIAADGAPIFKLPLLSIKLGSIQPFSNTFRIAAVLLESPEFYLERDTKGYLNFHKALPESKSPPSDNKDAAAPPLVLHIANFNVERGKVHFTDLRGPLPFKTVLAPVMISLEDFGTEKNHKSKFEMYCESEAKEKITASGTVCTDPLGAEYPSE